MLCFCHLVPWARWTLWIVRIYRLLGSLELCIESLKSTLECIILSFEHKQHRAIKSNDSAKLSMRSICEILMQSSKSQWMLHTASTRCSETVLLLTNFSFGYGGNLFSLFWHGAAFSSEILYIMIFRTLKRIKSTQWYRAMKYLHKMLFSAYDKFWLNHSIWHRLEHNENSAKNSICKAKPIYSYPNIAINMEWNPCSQK